MAGVPPVWMKREETDAVANEPGCMVQFCPFRINVKKEMEYGVKQEALIKGEEEVYIKMENKRIIPITFPYVGNCTPLKGVKDEVSPMTQENEMALIKGEEEDYIKMENKRIIPITFPDVGNCTPLKGVKDEVSPKSQEKQMFVEDPLGISWATDYIKEEPALNLEAEDTANIVAASASLGSSSKRLLQRNERCDFPVEETVRQGVSHNELEIGSEESTHLITFHEGEEEKQEEDSLSAPRLKCHLRENKCQTFICSVCLQSFTSKYYELMMHVFVHIDGLEPPKYVCKSCYEVFPSCVALKKHFKISEVVQDSSDNKEETFSCNGKSFTRLGTLKGHVLIDTESSSHKCDICGKSFTHLRSLKTHALIHIGTKDYKCDICGKSFSHSGTLKKHALIHTGIKPYKCDVCAKSFTQSSHLKAHVLIHTKTSPHKCNICGKSFTRSGTLNRHALIHTGTKQHKCDNCGKSFTRLSTLKEHALLHTGTRPHKCDICGKSFTQLSHIKSHALRHSGTRPHKCNICGKSFTELGALKKHALIHTGIKPHKCDVCAKSFTKLSSLKAHVLIHTTTKPHKCNICGKSFTLPKTLKRHALIHSG